MTAELILSAKHLYQSEVFIFEIEKRLDAMVRDADPASKTRIQKMIDAIRMDQLDFEIADSENVYTILKNDLKCMSKVEAIPIKWPELKKAGLSKNDPLPDATGLSFINGASSFINCSLEDVIESANEKIGNSILIPVEFRYLLRDENLKQSPFESFYEVDVNVHCLKARTSTYGNEIGLTFNFDSGVILNWIETGDRNLDKIRSMARRGFLIDFQLVKGAMGVLCVLESEMRDGVDSVMYYQSAAVVDGACGNFHLPEALLRKFPDKEIVLSLTLILNY